jgi:hypothetical protein
VALRATRQRRSGAAQSSVASGSAGDARVRPLGANLAGRVGGHAFLLEACRDVAVSARHAFASARRGMATACAARRRALRDAARGDRAKLIEGKPFDDVTSPDGVDWWRLRASQGISDRGAVEFRTVVLNPARFAGPCTEVAVSGHSRPPHSASASALRPGAVSGISHGARVHVNALAGAVTGSPRASRGATTSPAPHPRHPRRRARGRTARTTSEAA